MKVLMIINSPPYGSQWSYNAFRLARSLSERDRVELRVFLFGDGAGCAKTGQKPPEGFFNLGDMLEGIVLQGADVGVCVTCMDERGIREEDLIRGSRKRTLVDLTDWTLWADKVLVF